MTAAPASAQAADVGRAGELLPILRLTGVVLRSGLLSVVIATSWRLADASYLDAGAAWLRRPR